MGGILNSTTIITVSEISLYYIKLFYPMFSFVTFSDTFNCFFKFSSMSHESVWEHASRLLPTQLNWVALYGEYIKWMEIAGFRNFIFKHYIARFNVENSILLTF